MQTVNSQFSGPVVWVTLRVEVETGCDNWNAIELTYIINTQFVTRTVFSP
jgi:hypothetical protein